jgi:hypothetical protein
MEVRDMRTIALAGWLTACGSEPRCPEGQLWQDGCVDAVASDPEPALDVWAPPPGTSWQWQLMGALDTSVEVQMFDLDLFDAPQADIDALRARGIKVICYFSAGSYEDWRADADQFPLEARGAPLRGWPGEWWIDVMNADVREVLTARLDHAVARGCDGVEPDNVDGYANRNGLGLTATEQLDFNRFLADEAHRRGLSVGLKNDLDQLDDLVDWFDWALNEECAAYDECDRLAVFTEDAGRAVFHAEYVDRFAQAEAKAAEVCGVGPQLSTLVKTWDLGPERLDCAAR